MKLINDIKRSKYYRLIAVIVIALLALLAVAMLTHFVARWSADTSSEQEIRIQNLLTMQEDSLESVYLQEKIKVKDSLESKLLPQVDSLAKENTKLRDKSTDLKKEVLYFRDKYIDNPTLENCAQLVIKQQSEISAQGVVISGVTQEAIKWKGLYLNENENSVYKDSLLSKKERTLSTVNAELKKVSLELKGINDKINDKSWFKRNWKWHTNSYRNWLRNTN